ncbi:MAG: hypothetical protein A3G18_00560 [Rhodospirillales bacterium RIFCSPLOWO2_12_FULL_58_28]|nr:MAG: hypothetical protein A3H92_05495 [Rhodospirillales bacterium RIFCSPLOWO2_02_FULL_58_16]OHC77028.1 MAG: hypothetical protein A3G18_00560 [Rhodospirillales bacterium RIFCSPLOWO2_12_FULL_58_28]
MTAQCFSPVKACRICRSGGLVELFSLGNQSLSGRFPGPDEPDPPSAPLTIVKCGECGLVQLRDTVDFSQLYTSGYGYRSGTNMSMRNHLAGIANWIKQRCDLQSGDIVVDIGSNDETLLKNFDNAGLRRFGIDPLIGKFSDLYSSDVKTYEGFFSRSAFEKLAPSGKAKVITSISMFYDLENPKEFVTDISDILDKNGIWVLEQSYLPAMMENNSFDTICHEHLEYYCLKQIEYLMERCGLRVFDAERNDCNGGSLRIAACHKNGPYSDNLASLNSLREFEDDLGLDDIKLFDDFFTRISLIRNRLVELVKRETAAGKKIYLYGASTKGNILLQYCGIDHNMIIAAAERNPEKWGCRTPGTAIPIISEEEARRANPDYFLVLPWHFRREFIHRESEFLKQGGKLIFPLPEVEIVDKTIFSADDA